VECMLRIVSLLSPNQAPENKRGEMKCRRERADHDDKCFSSALLVGAQDDTLLRGGAE
jgi:hypothetical protein